MFRFGSLGLILGKCLALALASFLVGCSTASDAARETIRLAFAGDQSGASATPNNPAFRYLKVTSYGRASYLVLGYVEESGQQAPLEVWYSAKGEVLKTQAGRLAGTLGLETDWREVALSGAPSWAEVLGSKQVLTYQRRRDLMPGYRANVLDTLQLQEVPANMALSNAGALTKHLAAKDVRWFQEVASPLSAQSAQSSSNASSLPAAWYALRQGQVIYTLQCLSPSFCLSFEPWSPSP